MESFNTNPDFVMQKNDTAGALAEPYITCEWEIQGRRCGEVFSKEGLAGHVYDAHIKDSTDYRCYWQICGGSFKHRYRLRDHVRNHTGEKPFLCRHPMCGRTFTREANLTIHERVHTGHKPYPCRRGCEMKFANSSDRIKHEKDTHSYVKSYLCGIGGCTNTYKHTSSLRKHRQSVHSQVPSLNNGQKRKLASNEQGVNMPPLKRPISQHPQLENNRGTNPNCSEYPAELAANYETEDTNYSSETPQHMYYHSGANEMWNNMATSPYHNQDTVARTRTGGNNIASTGSYQSPSQFYSNETVDDSFNQQQQQTAFRLENGAKPVVPMTYSQVLALPEPRYFQSSEYQLNQTATAANTIGKYSCVNPALPSSNQASFYADLTATSGPTQHVHDQSMIHSWENGGLNTNPAPSYDIIPTSNIDIEANGATNQKVYNQQTLHGWKNGGLNSNPGPSYLSNF